MWWHSSDNAVSLQKGTALNSACSNQSNAAPVTSVDGLDELYDVSPDTAEVQAAHSQGTAYESQEQPSYAQGIEQWLTVEEAGRRLGISANAVIKRLGKGKLPGRKVAGQFGDKWLVDPEAIPKEIHVELSDTNPEDIPREQPGSSSGTAFGSQEQPGYAQGIAQKSLDVLGEVIRQQTEQIKVQNEVIKQLVDQVREKDQQIKLLADSQHKAPGWWARFCLWLKP